MFELALAIMIEATTIEERLWQQVLIYQEHSHDIKQARYPIDKFYKIKNGLADKLVDGLVDECYLRSS